MSDYTNLENALKTFCKMMTLDRDESHNYLHMFKVYENCQVIYEEMNLAKHIEAKIMAVALFHDIADHKYYSDSEKDAANIKIRVLLEEYFSKEETNDILFIIDNISFSREKAGLIRWNEFTRETLLIRNIVSDADKLEAIGKVGIERCLQYTKDKYGDKLTQQELIEHLEKHCQEKLYLLAEKYIRTDRGKKLARPLHEETISIVKNLKMN